MNKLGPDHFSKPSLRQCMASLGPVSMARRASRVKGRGRGAFGRRFSGLPTGTGKTAAIDIAVFHLACQADRGPARTAPLQILLVIDRRIVVDAAFKRV